MPIGVPQGSVLGPLLFLLYINDLNLAIKYCKVYHFADDTNLLYTNNSIKKLNKMLNKDLKNLTNWLNANKISLNVGKTEMILFKPIKKPSDCQLKVSEYPFKHNKNMLKNMAVLLYTYFHNISLNLLRPTFLSIYNIPFYALQILVKLGSKLAKN